MHFQRQGFLDPPLLPAGQGILQVQSPIRAPRPCSVFPLAAFLPSPPTPFCCFHSKFPHAQHKDSSKPRTGVHFRFCHFCPLIMDVSPAHLRGCVIRGDTRESCRRILAHLRPVSGTTHATSDDFSLRCHCLQDDFHSLAPVLQCSSGGAQNFTPRVSTRLRLLFILPHLCSCYIRSSGSSLRLKDCVLPGLVNAPHPLRVPTEL